MSWRGIFFGAVAGFAWILGFRALMAAGVVQATGDDAVWIALVGLAVVWLLVVYLVNRRQSGDP